MAVARNNGRLIKAQLAQDYPHHVALDAIETGFGARADVLTEVARAIAGGTWVQWIETKEDPQTRVFAFADPRLAHAFRARIVQIGWRSVLSEK